MNTLAKLRKQLERVERELDKCRTTVLVDGWQTSKHAKKARKWDYYGQEKNRLRELIEVEEQKEREEKEAEIYVCRSCLALDENECICNE